MELKANIGKEVLLPWLMGMRDLYEKKGFIPTLDLLIQDLEEGVEERV